jgi:hypothetical protein
MNQIKIIIVIMMMSHFAKGASQDTIDYHVLNPDETPLIQHLFTLKDQESIDELRNLSEIKKYQQNCKKQPKVINDEKAQEKILQDLLSENKILKKEVLKFKSQSLINKKTNDVRDVKWFSCGFISMFFSVCIINPSNSASMLIAGLGISLLTFGIISTLENYQKFKNKN